MQLLYYSLLIFCVGLSLQSPWGFNQFYLNVTFKKNTGREVKSASVTLTLTVLKATRNVLGLRVFKNGIFENYLSAPQAKKITS